MSYLMTQATAETQLGEGKGMMDFIGNRILGWARRLVLGGALLLPTVIAAQMQTASIWSLNLEDQPYEMALIGDVSDDGLPDLVAGTASDEVKCIESRHGEEWWSFQANGTVWCASGIGDVDGDTQDDVIAGTAANEIQCMSGGTPNGIAPQIWKYTATADVWSVCALPDITGDARQEAIAGTGDDRVLCLNGATGALLWQRPVGADVWVVRTIADLNGDGKTDVLAGCGDNKVYALSGADGSVIWFYMMNGDIWDVRAFPDVTGDGDNIPEVLAASADNKAALIKGNSTTTGTRLWEFDAASDVWTVSVMADITGDGVADVAAGGPDDNLYILNGQTGAALTTMPLGSALIVACGIADASRDGIGDVLAGDEWSRAACISGYSGALFWSYPFPAAASTRNYAMPARFSGDGVRGIAALPDLTGDGIGEVAAIAADGSMTCLNGMIFGLNAANLQWLHYR